MSVHCRLLGAPDIDPEGFRSAAEIYRADAAWRDPDDAPLPDRQVAADLFDPRPGKQRFVWLAELDGRPVGVAWAGTHSDEDDDLHLASVDVAVLPEFRRRGAARALVEMIVPRLVEAGQTSILGYTCREIETVAAEALCEGLGMTKRQEERCSRAAVADIDEALMDRWLADAATAAPGYRIEQWRGPCPEEFAERWAVAEASMDDMPLDDLDYTRPQLDVAAQRARDEAETAGGFLLYRTLALGPDGSAAGLTMLSVHEDRPEIAYQDDTGVVAAHRGRRLGRWLKAANYRQAKAAHPELAVLETYNAQSNPWMLDINVAMGFRPHHHYDAYQAPIDEVLARLGR
ncbi:MAG: GNAT family N-acetyltransferase [Actinomycetota bacterium]